MLTNISVEKLQQIEKERKEIIESKEFKEWCKELKVGIMFNNNATNLASDMMSQWTDKHGRLNSFKPVVDSLKIFS